MSGRGGARLEMLRAPGDRAAEKLQLGGRERSRDVRPGRRRGVTHAGREQPALLLRRGRRSLHRAGRARWRAARRARTAASAVARALEPAVHELARATRACFRRIWPGSSPLRTKGSSSRDVLAGRLHHAGASSPARGGVYVGSVKLSAIPRRVTPQHCRARAGLSATQVTPPSVSHAEPVHRCAVLRSTPRRQRALRVGLA